MNKLTVLDQARAISWLGAADHKILLEAIEDFRSGKGFRHVYGMSMFTQEGDFKEKGRYFVYELRDAPVTYLNRVITRKGPLLLDHKCRILPFSNHHFGTPGLFLQVVEHYLRVSTSLKGVPRVKPSLPWTPLAIQQWFITFGHFHDEVFSLADYATLNGLKFSPILDYPPTDDVLMRYRTTFNYERLQELALGSSAWNFYEAGRRSVVLNGCITIEHLGGCSTFHSFAPEVSRSIISKIGTSPFVAPSVYFVSREIATHLPRNIQNQVEIEDLCEVNRIKVLRPERIYFDRLVIRLNSAKAVIITWGGALTNLAYVREGAKVLILKSMSYQKEGLSLFDKIIQGRRLSVKVLAANPANLIDVKRLAPLLAWVQAD